MTINRCVVFDECGQPENVLNVVDGELKSATEGELTVKMKAAPINPADINFIQGVYGIKPTLPQSRTGLEGVGEVIESTDRRFNVGDEVIMLKGVGAWSQYVTAGADDFIRIPAGIDPLQSAMLKVNPLTAWRMLTGYVTLKEGDWIVQNAANSGVGRCIIQLAKSMGVKTINFVRRPDVLRNELTDLGANIVVGEDDEDVVKKTLELTGGVRPVLASNAVGGDSATRLMDMLAPGGSLVTFGAMSKKSIKVPNGFLIFKGVKLEGLWVTQWLKTASREDIEKAYAHLAQMMKDGKLIQSLDGVYKLDQVREAATKAQEEFRSGKIVLQIS